MSTNLITSPSACACMCVCKRHESILHPGWSTLALLMWYTKGLFYKPYCSKPKFSIEISFRISTWEIAQCGLLGTETWKALINLLTWSPSVSCINYTYSQCNLLMGSESSCLVLAPSRVCFSFHLFQGPDFFPLPKSQSSSQHLTSRYISWVDYYKHNTHQGVPNQVQTI